MRISICICVLACGKPALSICKWNKIFWNVSRVPIFSPPPPFERHVSIRDQSNEGNAMRIQPRPPSTYFPVCIEFPTGADESVELCGGVGWVVEGDHPGLWPRSSPQHSGAPQHQQIPRHLDSQPVLDPIPPQTTRKEMSSWLIRYSRASGISFQLHARWV